MNERLSLAIDSEGQLWVADIELSALSKSIINFDSESVNGYYKAVNNIPLLLDFAILRNNLVILTQDGRVGCWNRISKAIQYIELPEITKLVVRWMIIRTLDIDGNIHWIGYSNIISGDSTQVVLTKSHIEKKNIVDIARYNYRTVTVSNGDIITRTINDRILTINSESVLNLGFSEQISPPLGDDVIDITCYSISCTGIIIMLILYDDNTIKIYDIRTRQFIPANVNIVPARFIDLPDLNPSLIEDIDGDIYSVNINGDYAITITKVITPGRLIQQNITCIRSARSYKPSSA